MGARIRLRFFLDMDFHTLTKTSGLSGGQAAGELLEGIRAVHTLAARCGIPAAHMPYVLALHRARCSLCDPAVRAALRAIVLSLAFSRVIHSPKWRFRVLQISRATTHSRPRSPTHLAHPLSLFLVCIFRCLCSWVGRPAPPGWLLRTVEQLRERFRPPEEAEAAKQAPHVLSTLGQRGAKLLLNATAAQAAKATPLGLLLEPLSAVLLPAFSVRRRRVLHAHSPWFSLVAVSTRVFKC